MSIDLLQPVVFFIGLINDFVVLSLSKLDES